MVGEKKQKNAGKVLSCILCLAGILYLCVTGWMMSRHGMYEGIGWTFGTMIIMLLFYTFGHLFYASRVKWWDVVYLTSASSVLFLLQTASSYMVPYLANRSNADMESVAGRAEGMGWQFLLFMAVFVLMSLLFVVVGEAFLKEHLHGICGFCAAVLLIFGLLLLTIGGSDNTMAGDTTTLFGYQVGLPLMAVQLLSYVCFFYLFQSLRIPETTIGMNLKILWKKQQKTLWLLLFCLVSSCILLVSYVARHEFGIPFILFLGLFLKAAIGEKSEAYEKKSTKFIGHYLFLSVLVLIAVLIGVGAYRYFAKMQPEWMALQESGTDQSFRDVYGLVQGNLYSLGEKVNRMFVDFDQKQTALERVQSAGWFGNPDYAYLPAATSDFSIAVNIHYMGMLWFVLLVTAVFVFAIMGKFYYHRHYRETICATASEWSFYVILVLLIWNILANIGMTGIIGVSCFGSGKGDMHLLLSGLLLGMAIPVPGGEQK